MPITVTDPNPTSSNVVTVTEKARDEIKKAFAAENLPEGAGLRIGVKGGGCNGFSYIMGFDGAPTEDDIVQDIDGLKLFVDQKSALYLEGVTLNYVATLQQQGFVFENPNATGTCGCGQSFSA